MTPEEYTAFCHCESRSGDAGRDPLLISVPAVGLGRDPFGGNGLFQRDSPGR